MAQDKDSMRNILTVALSVCFVCSVVVSVAAVSLKPQRLANKELDRNKNILEAAGLFRQGETAISEVDTLFKQFQRRVVDLETKKVLSAAEVQAAGIDPDSYDQKKASKDSSLSTELADDIDVASISRQAKYSVVYLLETEGAVDRIVIPIHGYGLWSTLYGYVALEGDGQTVAGITFYEHAETAGLGGEVDNPVWKASWIGKKIYGQEGVVALKVIKPSNSKDPVHEIDALSGATLTSRGVENLIAFWMGKNGFGPVINQLKQG